MGMGGPLWIGGGVGGVPLAQGLLQGVDEKRVDEQQQAARIPEKMPDNEFLAGEDYGPLPDTDQELVIVRKDSVEEIGRAHV